MQELHLRELPIAQLTAVYANSQKTKPPYFSRDDFCLFRPRNNQLSPEVCSAIVALAESNELPGWLFEIIPDYQEIEINSTGTLPPEEKIWMTKGTALICPRYSASGVRAGMVVCEIPGNFEVDLFDEQGYSKRVRISTSEVVEYDVLFEVIQPEEEGENDD